MKEQCDCHPTDDFSDDDTFYDSYYGFYGFYDDNKEYLAFRIKAEEKKLAILDRYTQGYTNLRPQSILKSQIYLNKIFFLYDYSSIFYVFIHELKPILVDITYFITEIVDIILCYFIAKISIRHGHANIYKKKRNYVIY